MKNHYILNYNDSFINTNIDLTNNYTKGWETKKVNPFAVLTSTGFRFLLEMKMIPGKSNLFIGPPNKSSHIHVDNLVQSYAINYVWGAGQSIMRWFDIHDNETYEPALTTAGTDYRIYNDNQVNLIEEIDVSKNTLILVRTDIPHQVVNCSNNKRYCLSIRGTPVLNWNDAVTHFRPYILEESQRIEL